MTQDLTFQKRTPGAGPHVLLDWFISAWGWAWGGSRAYGKRENADAEPHGRVPRKASASPDPDQCCLFWPDNICLLLNLGAFSDP